MLYAIREARKIVPTGLEFRQKDGKPRDAPHGCRAPLALPTAIWFDRSWASRYALTLPCLKAYPKGFLRLARAIASAHQAPFFPATSHAAKTQIPPAYANEAPARKTLRAPGRGRPRGVERAALGGGGLRIAVDSSETGLKRRSAIGQKKTRKSAEKPPSDRQCEIQPCSTPAAGGFTGLQ